MARREFEEADCIYELKPPAEDCVKLIACGAPDLFSF